MRFNHLSDDDLRALSQGAAEKELQQRRQQQREREQRRAEREAEREREQYVQSLSQSALAELADNPRTAEQSKARKVWAKHPLADLDFSKSGLVEMAQAELQRRRNESLQMQQVQVRQTRRRKLWLLAGGVAAAFILFPPGGNRDE